MADVRPIDANELESILKKEIETVTDAYWSTSLRPAAYSLAARRQVFIEALDHVQKCSTLNCAPVVHAHWIDRPQQVEFGEKFHRYRYIEIVYTCSKCKNDTRTISEYCPYCGARMDEQEKNQ